MRKCQLALFCAYVSSMSGTGEKAKNFKEQQQKKQSYCDWLIHDALRQSITD